MLRDRHDRSIGQRFGQQNVTGPQQAQHGDHQAVLRPAGEHDVAGLGIEAEPLEPFHCGPGMAILVSLDLVVEEGGKPAR